MSKKYNKKCFHLTINEESLENFDKILSYLTGLSGFIYILVVEHLGQGNKHYHVYVQYENQKKLSVKKLYGSHIEICYSSAQKNISYLKCEDEKHKGLGVTYKLIYEEGTPRMKGGFYTVGELRECNDINQVPTQYYNIYKKIKEDEEKDMDVEDLYKEMEVYWIQGESGIGKTNKAKELIKEKRNNYEYKMNEVKYENGFWLGIGNAKIALYDDFRDSHMKPSEFINFIDYNKHYMNIKGGSKLNKYQLIIITSVQKLENIYLNVSSEPRKQWERK